MKFQVTWTGTYEVDDEDLMLVYDTQDPHECARIDTQNAFRDLLPLLTEVGFTVHPILDEHE